MCKKFTAAMTGIATGAFVLAGLITSTAANAASEAAADQDCVVNVQTGQQNCFAAGTNLNREIARITGQPVVTGVDADECKKNFDAVQAAHKNGGTVSPMSVASVSVILVNIYDDAGFGGGTYQFYASTSSSADCGDRGWSYFNLLGLGWGGRVSSFYANSGCYMTGWESTSAFNGASIGSYHGLSYVGDALNDRINSLSWKP